MGSCVCGVQLSVAPLAMHVIFSGETRDTLGSAYHGFINLFTMVAAARTHFPSSVRISIVPPSASSVAMEATGE